jgi:predicted nucleic acid-binding protein
MGPALKALFDTNILIDYLNGSEDAAAEMGRYHERLISVITAMEVLAGAQTAEQEDVIEMFLRDFRLVELSRAIMREAVDLRRTQRVRLPDAMIWATARIESALIVTRNTKDFPPTEPGVRIPY